ncbi:TadE/TadG family type IV pilus assembly protein [Evansella tamaricis]|uniref:Tad domain-containing protein n=1 Tax=Evansella tamaricis TaxID=2069301 RepID=A0ABS6JD37_9BACI|nr:Tad domain-containing protein [Evansella tamaricis]MBU9711583.1 Tad domain-containing protein [Evansella tamaricis]
MMSKSFLKNEDGSVIVIVAFCMSIFIACTALVVDFGSLYLEKSRLQKIVDAAVLAGAQELPSNRNRAVQEINKTILANNGDLDDFHISLSNNNTVVEVIGNKKGTLFFAKALGITEPKIEAKARIQLEALIAGTGAIPLGVQPTSNLSFGMLQTLMVTDSTNGNFGAVALTGSGASSFEADFTNGYTHELSVNTVLRTETGQMAGPTSRAVSSRISKCSNATYLNYPKNCPRVVLLPVIEPISNREVRVVGFATFFLENVSSNNQGAAVTGRFIEMTYPGTTGVTQTSFGTFGYRINQ